MESRDQVLQWFLTASEDDIHWLFSSLTKSHHQILEKVVGTHSSIRNSNFEINDDFLDAIRENSTGEDPNERGKSDPVLAREIADYHVANAEAPIVQFSCPMYYCSLDDESFISVDVIRIGNLSSKSEVTFTTKSGTAKAGEKFMQKSGRITFLEGSNSEEVQIDLRKSKIFDTTTEFVIELLLDPAPTNCQLGRYLYLSRVKVIDGNCFPSNKFAKQVQAAKVDSIEFWTLAWAYAKFNWQSPVTKSGTTKWLLIDLCRSLYLLLRLVCEVILVDKILRKKPDSAEHSLIKVSLAILCPLALLHFLDFRRTTWKVGGSSRGKLQRFLLRKFLNYKNAVRIHLSSADLIMAVTRDVSDLVHEGYIKLLQALAAVMDLLAVMLFQVVMPFLPMFDVKLNWLGFLFLFGFPIVFAVFLKIREAVTSKYIGMRNQAEVELVAQMERTVVNYHLIADYGQRPFFEARFGRRLDEYNTARVKANQVIINNKYFSPWVTNLCIFFYTVYGGLQVVADDGELSLGMFLANLSILKTIGAATGNVYSVLMDVEAISPALYRIVNLINLPTDVPQRKALNRFKRQRTSALREDARKKVETGWPADHLPLEIQNLKFTYDAQRGEALAMEGRIIFHQGELTAMVGPAGEGKSTLLYMLGGVVLPEPGQLFVPSHLRVLHVSTQNLFFKASLFENLTFGCLGGAGDTDAAIDRVITICKRLGFAKDILDLIEQGRDGPVQVWSEVVSHSQKSMLQFARSVITNPEVMCIHKPVMTYTDQVSGIVLEMLKEFCEQKGVEQDIRTRHLRRPRTCVITAAKIAAVRLADHIYCVSRKSGILYIPQTFMERSNSAGALQRSNSAVSVVDELQESQKSRDLRPPWINDFDIEVEDSMPAVANASRKSCFELSWPRGCHAEC